MKVLLVSPDAEARDLFRIAVGSIERRLGRAESRSWTPPTASRHARIGLRERPDVVVADEIASRAGAFAMARTSGARWSRTRARS